MKKKFKNHETMSSGHKVYDGALLLFLLWHESFGGSCVFGAEAISQGQPCMTSYFKGGVESWRVARPGQRLGSKLSASSPSLQWGTQHQLPVRVRTLIYGTGGLPSNQPWGPPRWWRRMTAAQTHTDTHPPTHAHSLTRTRMHAYSLNILKVNFHWYTHFHKYIDKNTLIVLISCQKSAAQPSLKYFEIENFNPIKLLRDISSFKSI